MPIVVPVVGAHLGPGLGLRLELARPGRAGGRHRLRLVALQHDLAAAHLGHELQEAAVGELAVLVGRQRGRQRARVLQRVAARLRAPARPRLRLGTRAQVLG